MSTTSHPSTRPRAGWRLGLAAAAMLAGALPAAAQVPHLINYQGRVTSGGQNFDGSGQFKFALANAAGTTAYWSNSGAAGALAEPPTAVTLSVQKGVFSVVLGDASVANMQTLPASVFTEHSDVRLHVWFDDGVHGFEPLLPPRRIAAVGYAIAAETVADGAITAEKMAPGAAKTALDADGLSAVPTGASIISDQFGNTTLLNAGYKVEGRVDGTASDHWTQLASAPEARRSHTAVLHNVSAGLLVWGGYRPVIGGEELTNVGLHYHTDTDSWTPMSTVNAPSPRHRHTAVVASNRMIVWGGTGDQTTHLGDGGHYNPVTDTWTPIPATGSLTARRRHTAVYTGNLMIIWGGELANGALSGTGARFDPDSFTWTQTAIGLGAPSSRAGHSAVVLPGNKMAVWGGLTSSGLTNSGSVYDVAANTWTALPTLGAPTAREDHHAVVTGTGLMIVWGGAGSGGVLLNDGAIYNSGTNAWTPLATTGAPAGRSAATFTYAGSDVLCWGGANAGGTALGDGKVFDFSNNQWEPFQSFTLPPARFAHSATWLSTRTLVFGGKSGANALLSDLWAWKPSRVLYIYTRQ